MSDATYSPQADRDLLFGVLAMQLDFVTRDDLCKALQLWAADRSQSLGHVLVENNFLAAHRRSLLEELLDEYLVRHDMDPARGLAAACAARQNPLELDSVAGPAMRGTLATLPSISSAIVSGPGPEDAPASVGLSTSSGKRFRIIRSHARGALGEVFLAHDEELNREVALKEIQPPYANHPDSRVRFLLEAEITGSLEHPGIVPVYGLGRYPDGRPYYAMRFIRGESLHDAIQRHHLADHGPDHDPGEQGLALRRLLMHFVAVCHAIAYAHSRGIVHRDIKPSNVMLGSYGETLVVDWGLAKPMDRPTPAATAEAPIQPVSGKATLATMLGQAVGTPAFMSPEQAAGRIDEIGPASDVYSLGATLYQLLTGLPPHTSEDTSEIMRQVQRHEFPPPRQLKKSVPPPLESVVLKAMSLVPAERYASAKDLAQDVERWLADEPVQAHRERAAERTLRWMRHHRSLVAGVGALLMTALVALGIGLWAVGRQRDVARQNLALAQRAVNECFVLASETPLLQQEKMRGVRKLLLEAALPFYEGFQNQGFSDDNVRLADAVNHYRIAVITAEIGKKSDAAAHLERARAELVRLVRKNPDVVELGADLGRVLNDLGVLQRELGQTDEALASLDEALILREKLGRRYPERADYQSDLALTYNNLGILLRPGHRQRAEENFNDARLILSELVLKFPGQPAYQAALAGTYQNLGRLLADEGRRDEALNAHADACKNLRELAGKHPDVAEYRANLASALLNRAKVEVDAGLFTDALRSYDEGLKLCEELVHEQPEVSEYATDLARACNGLGVLVGRTSQAPPDVIWHHQMQDASERFVQFLQVLLRTITNKESLRLLNRARQTQEKLVAHHAEEPLHRIELAGTLANLGNEVREAGLHPEAREWYTKAIEEIGRLSPPAQEQPLARSVLARAYSGRAETRVNEKQHAASLPDWRQALEFAEGAFREDVRMKRLFALGHAGHYREAEAEVKEILGGKKITGELLYNLACIRSLAARAAATDGRRPPRERAAEADALAAEAVNLLRRAAGTGFFAEAARRQFVKDDGDLDFLRDRADYRKFEEELGRKKD